MSGSVQQLKQPRARKPKTELESRSLKDGAICLFRWADHKKPTWFCRVKVPNGKGHFQASIKAKDEHEAFSIFWSGL